MPEFQVTLTTEERKCLQEVLELALKETQVEEHRTRTLTFREHILHREELINGVLKKLRQ